MRSALRGGFKVHVTNQLAVRHAVNAYINNDGTVFNPFAFYNAWLANSDHDNVGLANMAGCILGEAVARGYGAALKKKLQPHWAANNVRCTNNDGVLAANINTRVLEQINNACRCAWVAQVGQC